MACLITGAAILMALPMPASATSGVDAPPGTPTTATPLPATHWIPATTSNAYRLEYVTTDAQGAPAVSTGAVFIPKGTAPTGGWPVVAWGHGTVGIGDDCAPSAHPRTERDGTYLAAWMSQGYAVVATDYVGLGTPGLSPYLHGNTAAHNMVDMVRAGVRFARTSLPPGQQLSTSWVAIGQSQGAGAAIYTAAHATEFGGDDLDYRGAVGTGTPAGIETYVKGLGPYTPLVPLPGLTTAFLSYVLAGLRDVHPELNLDSILTDNGRRYLGLAETMCVEELAQTLEGVSISTFFTNTVGSLPDANRIVDGYLGMPLRGFDQPFFIAHGLIDLAVPLPLTAAHVVQLQLGEQPVTFRTYPSDHSGTMKASLVDTIPFVRKQFALP